MFNTRWQEKLYHKLLYTFQGDRKQAANAVKVSSKHSRAKTHKHGNKRHEKIRRQMSTASRKINRKTTNRRM